MATGLPAFGADRKTRNEFERLKRQFAELSAQLTTLEETVDGLGGAAGDITSVTAGTGLTGGGAAGAVTLDVAANADGSIVVNANDVQVGVLATNGQHGNRGGGALHDVATTASAGFMSAAHFDIVDRADLQDVFLYVASDLATALTYLQLNGGGSIASVSNHTVNWLAPFNCTVVECVLYCIGVSYGTTIIGAHINENLTPDTSDTQAFDSTDLRTFTLGSSLSAGDRVAVSFDGQFSGGPFTGYIRVRPT